MWYVPGVRAHLGPLNTFRLLAVFALVCLSACDDLDGGLDCETVCAFEEECGLRTFEECQQASCIGDLRVPSAADTCMQLATDCAAAAQCTCPDACGKVEECTESPDESCAERCDTLVEQDPITTYRENRCLIESSCDDLATCGGVGG